MAVSPTPLFEGSSLHTVPVNLASAVFMEAEH